MWCWAILLPTPREPECRNNQTRLVPGDLDEVIAGPERAELQVPLPEEARGIELGAHGGVGQRCDPVTGVLARDGLIAGAG